MKTSMKALTLVLCAVLLVCASVMGTLAYLKFTTQTVKNTFTIGKVEIKLDETDVDVYGKKDSDTRVLANEYKLLPGHTYTKDPMVTVLANSEDSYIRMMVTINWKKDYTPAGDIAGKTAMEVLQTVFPEWTVDGVFLLENLINGWNPTMWKYTSYSNGTYEFRYFETVNTLNGADKELKPLFTEIKMPGNLTNEQIALLNNMEIQVVAHAMQADGFADDNAAWAAFSTDVR